MKGRVMSFSVRLAVVIYVGFLLAGSLLVYRDQAVAFAPQTDLGVHLTTPCDDARAIDAPQDTHTSMRFIWDRDADPSLDHPSP